VNVYFEVVIAFNFIAFYFVAFTCLLTTGIVFLRFEAVLGCMQGIVDKFLSYKFIFGGDFNSSKHISSHENVYGWGAVVQLVKYRTRNQEVAGSTHTRSTASNLEQVANPLCA